MRLPLVPSSLLLRAILPLPQHPGQIRHGPLQYEPPSISAHSAGGFMSTLRIVLRNYADFENALTEEARLFETSHPGTKIELISVGIHDLYKSAISDCGLQHGHFDLALLVTDWLAEAHAAGALEDLNPWHKRIHIAGWPDGWQRTLVQP